MPLAAAACSRVAAAGVARQQRQTRNTSRGRFKSSFLPRWAVGATELTSAGVSSFALPSVIFGRMVEQDRRAHRGSDELAEQADVIVTVGCGRRVLYVSNNRCLDWHLADPQGRSQCHGPGGDLPCASLWLTRTGQESEGHRVVGTPSGSRLRGCPTRIDRGVESSDGIRQERRGSHRLPGCRRGPRRPRARAGLGHEPGL